MKNESILGFDGQYHWLSNFAMGEVELDGITYASVEHAYQAAKTFNPELRAQIRNLKTPGEAKRAGRKFTLIPDWDIIKLAVMEDLVRQKFSKEPFRTWLLETGDAYLEETNWWHDTFWGVCKGIGENNLGKILMKIRAELRMQTC